MGEGGKCPPPQKKGGVRRKEGIGILQIYFIDLEKNRYVFTLRWGRKRAGKARRASGVHSTPPYKPPPLGNHYANLRSSQGRPREAWPAGGGGAGCPCALVRSWNTGTFFSVVSLLRDWWLGLPPSRSSSLFLSLPVSLLLHSS